MIVRVATAAVLGLILGACAAGPPPEPPPPPPLDPVGTYDLSIGIEGMEILGVLVIRGSAEDGYTGSIDTEMGGAAIADITVEGQTVIFSIPEVGAGAELLFEGDTFSGWVVGDMGEASMSGTKRTLAVSRSSYAARWNSSS